MILQVMVFYLIISRQMTSSIATCSSRFLWKPLSYFNKCHETILPNYIFQKQSPNLLCQTNDYQEQRRDCVHTFCFELPKIILSSNGVKLFKITRILLIKLDKLHYLAIPYKFLTINPSIVKNSEQRHPFLSKLP